MHTYGIKPKEVFDTFLCPGCNEPIGLSLKQIEDALENSDFNCILPDGQVCVLSPLQLKRSLEKKKQDQKMLGE